MTSSVLTSIILAGRDLEEDGTTNFVKDNGVFSSNKKTIWLHLLNITSKEGFNKAKDFEVRQFLKI